MRKIIIGLFLLILFNCKGENSPITPINNEKDFYKTTGILNELEYDTITNCWDIHIGWLSDSMVINVYVRENSSSMWVIPNWYCGNGHIKILIDSFYDAFKIRNGYEYKIVGLK